MSIHLCKTDLTEGSGAERYPLIADGSDLLVVTSKSSWSGKTLVVTPKEEYYAQALTLGRHSNYTATMGASDSDAKSMQNRIGNIRNAMTIMDWNEGHRPMFQYWARGFCPYYIKNYNATSSSVLRENSMRFMELCAVYKMLRFDLYNFPCGKCSSFKAYFRFWNLSCLEYGDLIKNAQPGLHFHADDIYYRFSNTVHPPAFHRDVSEFDTSYGTLSMSTKYNRSTVSHGVTVNRMLPYDPWNAHDGTKSGYDCNTFFMLYGREDGDYNKRTTPYYADVEITGNGLKLLKECLKRGNSVWAYMGFTNNDAQSSDPSYGSGGAVGQAPYTTLSVYTSRVELIIVASWSRFNY